MTLANKAHLMHHIHSNPHVASSAMTAALSFRSCIRWFAARALVAGEHCPCVQAPLVAVQQQGQRSGVQAAQHLQDMRRYRHEASTGYCRAAACVPNPTCHPVPL